MIDYPYPIIRKRKYISRAEALKLFPMESFPVGELVMLDISTINPNWHEELYLPSSEPNDNT